MMTGTYPAHSTCFWCLCIWQMCPYSMDQRWLLFYLAGVARTLRYLQVQILMPRRPELLCSYPLSLQATGFKGALNNNALLDQRCQRVNESIASLSVHQKGLLHYERCHGLQTRQFLNGLPPSRARSATIFGSTEWPNPVHQAGTVASRGLAPSPLKLW